MIVRFRVAYIMIQQYHSFEVCDFVLNFDVQYSTIYVGYANPDWILLQVSQTNIFTRRIILCVNITSENIMIIATRFFSSSRVAHGSMMGIMLYFTHRGQMIWVAFARSQK